jgi:hypothetical protein
MRHAHDYLIEPITLEVFPPQDRLSAAGRDFVKLFSSHRTSLEAFSQRHAAKVASFRLAQSHNWRELCCAQTVFAEAEALAEGLYVEEGEVLTLDVGGQGSITTAKRTLMKYPDSALSAMFSGRHALPLHNGKVFVDRNYRPFARMISFLRTGRIPRVPSSSEEQELKEEMDYWGVPWELNPLPILLPSPRTFDHLRSSSSIQFKDDFRTAVKEGLEHAVLFLSQPLSPSSPYLDFQVTLEDYPESNYQLLVGLVPHFSYRESSSPLWCQAPNSYFWDVCENRLLQTDASKRVTECPDYSCFCEEEDSSFGMRYDPRFQSISFYKNGICQGQAFSRVELPLTPVLDLQFEAGTVQLK